MAITDNDIDERMGTHDAHLSGDMQSFRHLMIQTAKAALIFTPPSREQSLMMTHLEEALMWGNKAITARYPLTNDIDAGV